MSVPKAEGPWLHEGETLVCFGDSLTAAAEGYIAFLRQALEPRGIRVVNAGVPGDKTPAALTRLKSDVVDAKPDAVSIFFGNNDALIGRGVWRDEPGISPLAFEDNLKWIIHLCRLLGKIEKFSISTIAPRLEGDQFLDFGDVNRAYCRAARNAADAMNSLLVPLDSVFTLLREENRARMSPEGLLYTRDGLHMNGEGCRIIADAMLRAWRMI